MSENKKTIIVRNVPTWLDFVISEHMNAMRFEGTKNDYMLKILHESHEILDIYKRMMPTDRK